jgi:hypothetical protein
LDAVFSERHVHHAHPAESEGQEKKHCQNQHFHVRKRFTSPLFVRIISAPQKELPGI